MTDIPSIVAMFENIDVYGRNPLSVERWLPQTRLSDSMTNKFKVLRYLQGLTIETNKFAFEVKVILGLETTFLVLES